MLDDPVDNFLQHLDDAKAVGKDKWEARCPAHDDRHASLSIGRGADGRVLLHCHAGCSPVQVCSAMGLSMKALFPPKEHDSDKGRIAATYDYRDGEGNLLYQVVRLSPKSFRQRRPNGQGGWVWNLGRVPRVLYRLPELLATDPAEPVLVVEGEKDVENLCTLGFVATCNPGGAGKWDKLADDSALHGRTVVIVADRDEPGRKHAADVAARLSGHAARVCVLELPGGGKDASDWIDAGGTAEQLRALIQAALDNPAPIPPANPSVDTSTDDQELPPGSTDPDTGKLILSPAKTLPTALAFIKQFHTHQQHRTLYSYAGQFMAWRGNQYVPIEEQSLRQTLQPWLHDALRYQFDKRTGQMKLVGFESNPRTIQAALESIRTLVHLPASMTPPLWLDGRPEHPDPHNLLPFPSGTLDLNTRP